MIIQPKAHDKKAERSDPKKPFSFTKTEKRTAVPAWMAMALTGLFACFKEVAIVPSLEAARADDHAGPASKEAPNTDDVGADANGVADSTVDNPVLRPSHASEILDEAEAAALDAPQLIRSGVISMTRHVRSVLPLNDNRTHIPAPNFAPGSERGRASGPTAAPSRVQHSGRPADGHVSKPIATPPRPNPTVTANRPPALFGPLRLNDVVAGQTVLLTLGDLLLGARDPDGDHLQISNVTASNGSLLQIDDGWSYHADAGAKTTATLHYDISDGHTIVHQVADIHVLSAIRTLSDGDDIEVGSVAADQIEALNGNDVIDAGRGADVVDAGAGNDHVLGGDGNDMLWGGSGDDVIFGDSGNDIVSGGDGSDRVFGDAGNDTLSGDGGNDYISGGEGNDVVQAGDGDDLVDGGTGDDDLDGGDGVDTLDYSTSAAAVAVDLPAHTASGVDIGQDRIANFELVVGSIADDLFCVGQDHVSICGGGGNDIYQFHTDSAQLQITDFAVGDRIKIGVYEVMELGSLSERLELGDIYNFDANDDACPIRVRSGACDGFDVTILEARSHHVESDYQGTNGGADDYEIHTSLTGHHDLVYLLYAIV